MKKLLALLLTFVMLLSVSSINTFALFDEVSDEFLAAVRVEYGNESIQKNEVMIYYLKELSQGKFVTKYAVSGYFYTCDMVDISVGKYVISTSRPEPVIYSDGTMYDIVNAYEQGIINDDDLYTMSEFEELHMVSSKITGALSDKLKRYEKDEYINVRFEVQGSDYTLSDIDKNWVSDLGSATKKLDEHYESLHQKLVNEVLKDIDYIERAHNNGISVIAVKHNDIFTVVQSDFVTELDYVSEIHMKYIDTYKPKFKEYVYDEKCWQYDESGNLSYALINAHSITGSTAEAGFRFGDIIVESPAIYSNFTYGYGIYDFGMDKFYDVYDLKDCADKYYRLESSLAFYSRAKEAGDINNDGALTVLDATMIQRHLAKLDVIRTVEFVSHDGKYVSNIADTDKNGMVTVLDATVIQKKIAKYI